MNVLIIGSTGDYAKLIIPALQNKGIKVKGLVRDEKKGQKAIANGVEETVIANLNDVESLQKAVQNVDGVFHINPVFSKNEVQMGLNMVKAAAGAGVEKFVFSSVYHPSLSLGNHASKRPVEEALYQSNLNFIILQPAMFMQTIGNTWPSIKKTRSLRLPYSKKSKMSLVDYRDVAEVTAIAFAEDRLNNGTFELSSEGTYDRQEMAHIIGDILGTDIEADKISFEEFEKKSAMHEELAKEGRQAMFDYYDKHGFHGGNSLILETILGRKPTNLKAYFQELAQVKNSRNR